MKLSTYNRLRSANIETRGTRRKDVAIAAQERCRDFARHVRKFDREGLLTMPRFSPKYYATVRQLRLEQFGITD